MRIPALVFTASLAAAACTPPPPGGTRLEMTVTSLDKQAIDAVARDLGRQGLQVAMVETQRFDDAAKPRSSWTAMAQRTGTLTQAQIDAFAASCARYAQQPGVGCTSKTTTER